MLTTLHKLNELYLSDLVEINAQEDTSAHTLWETLKCLIQGETIKYFTKKKKLTSKTIFA